MVVSKSTAEHAQYHFIRSSTAVRISTQTWHKDYPIVIHPDCGVFEPASLFLRELAKWRSQSIGSLHGVAYIICAWCNYLQDRGYAWNEATESHYHAWLTDRRETGVIAAARQGRLANVIMRWCHFLASRNLGGPFLRLFSASISTAPLDIKNLQPKGRFKPRRGPKLKWGKRPVPDPDGVAQVLEALAAHCDPFIAERNWLLGRTAYETGLRAMGLTSLSCGTIEAMLQGDRIIGPIDRIDLFATDRARKAEIRSRLDRLIKSGRENLFASVTEKGGKTRTVAFPIELVLALCEHIWGERHALIRTGRGGRGANSSRHLWLSKKNLSQLERSSVKEILRMRGFVAAGVKGSGHSLRAVFLTEYARRLLREAKNKFGQSYDAHALLIMLAEIAGHEDPTTLKNYLDEARIREALTGDRQFLKRL